MNLLLSIDYCSKPNWYKNLAIANRSRVSCAHNMSRASMNNNPCLFTNTICIRKDLHMQICFLLIQYLKQSSEFWFPIGNVSVGVRFWVTESTDPMTEFKQATVNMHHSCRHTGTLVIASNVTKILARTNFNMCQRHNQIPVMCSIAHNDLFSVTITNKQIFDMQLTVTDRSPCVILEYTAFVSVCPSTSVV